MLPVKIIKPLVASLYVLYSNETYRIEYVGLTKRTTRKRLCGHICDSNRFYSEKDKWVKETISKGFKIFIKTVKKLNTIKSGKESEIKLIQYLLSKGYSLKNSTQGGDGILNPTKKLREKLSNAKIGKKWTLDKRNKILTARAKSLKTRGWAWNEDSKEKASKAKKGKPSNNKHPVFQYDFNNDFIRNWDSVTEAARFYGISTSVITNNLMGRSKTTRQGYWREK